MLRDWILGIISIAALIGGVILLVLGIQFLTRRGPLTPRKLSLALFVLLTAAISGILLLDPINRSNSGSIHQRVGVAFIFAFPILLFGGLFPRRYDGAPGLDLTGAVCKVKANPNYNESFIVVAQSPDNRSLEPQPLAHPTAFPQVVNRSEIEVVTTAKNRIPRGSSLPIKRQTKKFGWRSLGLAALCFGISRGLPFVAPHQLAEKAALFGAISFLGWGLLALKVAHSLPTTSWDYKNSQREPTL